MQRTRYGELAQPSQISFGTLGVAASVPRIPAACNTTLTEHDASICTRTAAHTRIPVAMPLQVMFKNVAGCDEAKLGVARQSWRIGV